MCVFTQQSPGAGNRLLYLDESVYFHFSAFSQSFNLHLADGTHVQMVDCRAASKTEDRDNEFNMEAKNYPKSLIK